MKLEPSITLGELAKYLDLKFKGDSHFKILGLNEIHVVETGDITFVDHPKYYKKALESSASVVLINKDIECPEGKHLIISEDPFNDFNKIILKYRPFKASNVAISEDAIIGNGSIVQPNVFIGERVKIGKNCIIHPNVVIYRDVEIGDNVIINANTTIGSDAFYFKTRETSYDKFHTCGRVLIGSDVEIGSNCTIDRGVTGDTIIGKGCKLDNQIHIGHDTVIGERCLIAAQSGIAGVCKIGRQVIMWGQAGVAKDIEIGDGATILSQSGVLNSLEGSKRYMGTPAEDAFAKSRQWVSLRKLPEIVRLLKV
jgi:UDP-3-O-[3-hydroxymyristoyl] glucosamine N-acyltransferase